MGGLQGGFSISLKLFPEPALASDGLQALGHCCLMVKVISVACHNYLSLSLFRLPFIHPTCSCDSESHRLDLQSSEWAVTVVDTVLNWVNQEGKGGVDSAAPRWVCVCVHVSLSVCVPMSVCVHMCLSVCTYMGEEQAVKTRHWHHILLRSRTLVFFLVIS